MSIAVWTDADGRVERIHYRPADVDTSDAHVTNASKPEAQTDDWVEDDLYYDESTDAFSFQFEDPFEGLSFSTSEKQRVFDAVQKNDLVEVRNIVEEALQA